MSRRTEIAYKAKSPDESAQHDEVPDLRRYGKCCGCVETGHVIIRGDLFGMRLQNVTAPVVATRQVIEQESAEAIVGVGKRSCVPGSMETSRERPRGNRWRTHPTEGPNIKNEEEFYYGLLT